MLAAGAGRRLTPLTELVPKALCPVAGAPLVDWAIARARHVTPRVAVNAHHRQSSLARHLEGSGVHVQVERDRLLGTAGALGNLKPWIDGRHVLVVNADSWHQAPLERLLDGWDGERPRLLTVVHPALATWGDRAYAGAALLPWEGVRRLGSEPSGLWEVWWRELDPVSGAIEFVPYGGPWFDCGTPARYLAANLSASGGEPVIGPGSVIEGTVERSVVWAGARVSVGESLRDAIRASDRLTVLVR